MRRLVSLIGLCLAILAPTAVAQDEVQGPASRVQGPEPEDAFAFLRLGTVVRVGLATISGSVRRDRGAVDGTQVALARDLDLDDPAAFAAGEVSVGLGRRLALVAQVAGATFEGRRQQGGGSLFSPVPPPLILDGITFVTQSLRSELRLVFADAGVLADLGGKAHARVAAGGGLHFCSAELEVAAVGGATARETTEALVPWIGARLALDAGHGFRIRLGGRGGAIWVGDRARHQTNTLFGAWAELAWESGPLGLGLRIDVGAAGSERRRHHDDEDLELGWFAPSVSAGVRL